MAGLPRGAPRFGAAWIAWSACAALLFAGFVALGCWQLERRAWKLDLIARVEERVHAPAVQAPGRERWAQVDRARDEYRHVRVTGRFLHDKETLVTASTGRGSGFWVLTPLRTADGSVVLVNRGFVPPEARGPEVRRAGEAQGEQVVEGLLRMTEPGGGFLRKNDPAQERWYSRDVQAIAAARGLADVAPYFVDAKGAEHDAERDRPEAPVGGLTVVSFSNNHLVYAITWFGLAAMVVVAGWIVARRSEDTGHD